jgi:hypothetical protein
MFWKLIRVIAWASLAFIVFSTLSPIGLRPHLAGAGVERFSAFSLAGLLFGLAYPRRLWWVLVIVLGSAAGLEVLQHLTPDRHGEVRDAVVKSLGGTFGISCSLAVNWLLAIFGVLPMAGDRLRRDASRDGASGLAPPE